MSSTQKSVTSEKKPTNRREQRAQAQSFIDSLQGEAFPNSRRIYLQGERTDIRVPMREIQLSPTLVGGGKDTPQYEENEAIPVYETAGPYGDPEASIDVHAGLAKCAPAGLLNGQTPKNFRRSAPVLPSNVWPTKV